MRPDHSRLLLILCSACLATWASAHAQQGHRVTTRSVVVNTAAHWLNWQLPTHAVDTAPDGAIKPHFFRERYNLLEDLETFTRPIESRYQILRRRP